MKTQNSHSIEGTIQFKRSNPDEQTCVCCPPRGGHIYNRHVLWDDGSRTDVMPLLSKVMQDVDNEGKRVRASIEILPDSPVEPQDA